MTLTYEESRLPEGNSLSDEHWRQFTKGIGYRYFGCGEYGSRLGRPHYHAILFGIDALAAEQLALSRWPYGFVCVRPFCFEHAGYVAAYTVKKLNRQDDSRLAPGQLPEFARMSRRPAIGTGGLAPFSSWLTSREGVRFLSETRDVPQAIKSRGALFPLGRTLRDKLRESCDIPADDVVRNERRRAAYRLAGSIPELVAHKERRRVGRYEVMKARAARRYGSL